MHFDTARGSLTMKLRVIHETVYHYTPTVQNAQHGPICAHAPVWCSAC